MQSETVGENDGGIVNIHLQRDQVLILQGKTAFDILRGFYSKKPQRLKIYSRTQSNEGGSNHCVRNHTRTGHYSLEYLATCSENALVMSDIVSLSVEGYVVPSHDSQRRDASQILEKTSHPFFFLSI